MIRAQRPLANNPFMSHFLPSPLTRPLLQILQQHPSLAMCFGIPLLYTHVAHSRLTVTDAMTVPVELLSLISLLVPVNCLHRILSILLLSTCSPSLFHLPYPVIFSSILRIRANLCAVFVWNSPCQYRSVLRRYLMHFCVYLLSDGHLLISLVVLVRRYSFLSKLLLSEHFSAIMVV